MKRLLIAVAATLLMAPQALAYSVGYLDFAKIQQESKVFKQAQAEFNAEQEKVQKELELRQKKLEEARKAQKEEELEKLQTQYTQEMGEMRDGLQKLQASLYKKFDQQLLTSVKGVATQKKVDVVLAKEAVYYGGVDITADVLKLLDK